MIWPLILTAGGVTFLLRIAPAIFKKVYQPKLHPQINQLLDYIICMITGEIIYSIAFADTINDPLASIEFFLLVTATLSLTAILMLYTANLLKSFLSAILFFALGYYYIIGCI